MASPKPAFPLGLQVAAVAVAAVTVTFSLLQLNRQVFLEVPFQVHLNYFSLCQVHTLSRLSTLESRLLRAKGHNR
jgi:hypothetical protein